MRLSYTPPPGWDFPTIGDLAKPEKGSIRIGPFGSALKKHEYSETGVRVLGIEDVHPNQFLSDRCKYIPDAKFCELRQYEVNHGDVLVTNMGTVGRACVVPVGTQKSIISSHLIKVSLDRSRADPNYLCWMLNYSPLVVAQIRAKSHGAIMAGFNSSLLKSLRIPFPPLAEQKRIARILDAADASRAKRREALAQLDTLLQSTFLDMFGDPATNPMGWPRPSLLTLLETAELFVDGDWVESKDQEPDGDVRLIQLADIGDGVYLDKSSRFLASDTARRLRCTPLHVGDILVARMPDPLGRACLFPGDERKAITVVDICIIRPRSGGPHPTWLMCCINTTGFRSLIAREATGTTRSRISRGNLSRLPIIAPPTALQHRFAAIAESVERQRASQRAHLAELDNLFASLQSRAFRGEL